MSLDLNTKLNNVSAVWHFCLNAFSVCRLKASSAPFRRIRDEEIEVDPRLANNSFDAKVRCT